MINGLYWVLQFYKKKNGYNYLKYLITKVIITLQLQNPKFVLTITRLIVKKIMLNSNLMDNYWKTLEKKKPVPKFVKKINILEFDKLKKSINSKNEIFVKNLARKMYNGEAFILRNAAKKNLKNIMINLAKHYDKKQKPSFYKMLDGTPNFHRIINKKITKKYSLYAIKHSYFLYNWNIKSKLEKDFKKEVYRHWRYVKFLAGNSKFQYEKNIPSQVAN